MQECCSTNDSDVRSLGVRHGGSDAGMETAESNDCRGVSKKDRDANDVLAATREGARFSCKDGQKFIDPFTQSISGLC